MVIHSGAGVSVHSLGLALGLRNLWFPYLHRNAGRETQVRLYALEVRQPLKYLFCDGRFANSCRNRHVARVVVLAMSTTGGFGSAGFLLAIPPPVIFVTRNDS